MDRVLLEDVFKKADTESKQETVVLLGNTPTHGHMANSSSCFVILAKKATRASRLLRDLAAQRSVSHGTCYHFSQVCLSCRSVFIVQTIRLIILDPISRWSFKNR